MIRALLASFVLLVLSAGPVQAEKLKFIAAGNCAWPPMEYVDESGKPIGYTIDYLNAVAQEAGFELEFKNVGWDGIFAGVGAKRYDIIASSVTVTEERKKFLDFSDSYFTVKQALIVPKDVDVKDMAEMEGKRVGAQIGTTGHLMLMKNPKIKAEAREEVGLAVEALMLGRMDAVVADDPIAYDFVLGNPRFADKLKVAFVIPADEPEEYAFAIAKGNTELLNLLNTGIAKVKEKGIDEELRNKWIGGKPITNEAKDQAGAEGK